MVAFMLHQGLFLKTAVISLRRRNYRHNCCQDLEESQNIILIRIELLLLLCSMMRITLETTRAN